MSYQPSTMVRQSAAELLGAAITDLFPGTQLVACSATEHGFSIDFIAAQPVDEQALILLEEKMRAFTKQNLEVRAIEMMKENAAQFLEHQGQNIRAAEVRRAKSNIVTLFQLGDFCDLCHQPFIAETQEVGPVKLFSIEEAGVYLPGKGMTRVKRIHGAVSVDKSGLKKHVKVLEAAKKVDYRQLAKEMDIFIHHDLLSNKAFSWGSSGTILKKILLDWWNDAHCDRFQLITTPMLIKETLVKMAGFYDLMPTDASSPSMTIDGMAYIVPPSLTPSHAAFYQSGLHSYRELPLRLAECGQVLPVSRTEGLRGMQHTHLAIADSAHSFCTLEQIKGELISSLQFIDKIIKMFDFEYHWQLHGRNQPSAGTTALWKKVNGLIEEAFQECGMAFAAAEHEFAFAGPAVEAMLIDSLGREWKGPKIGIDFNVPERLGLRYQGADDEMHLPVMVVRTIFGSLERFVALLLEHYAGRLPLWLAPEQVRIVPVGKASTAYAEKVGEALRAAGVRFRVDGRTDEQLGKRVHWAQSKYVPYVVVVGEKELKNNEITVRSCDDETMLLTMTTEELVRRIADDVSLKAQRKHVKKR